MNQIFAGLIAEGKTDYQFFEPIILKTLTEIAFECKGQIDIVVKALRCDKGNSFKEYVLNACGKSLYSGITFLIVHTDADSSTSQTAYKNKINPALEVLSLKDENEYCKHVVALIPVYETESWMFADKELLKKSINTTKNDSALKISGNPETFTDPKECLENAIRIGRADMPKKNRDKLKISDLYSIIGQSLDCNKLNNLKSYQDFKENIKRVLIDLNLLESEIVPISSSKAH